MFPVGSQVFAQLISLAPVAAALLAQVQIDPAQVKTLREDPFAYLFLFSLAVIGIMAREIREQHKAALAEKETKIAAYKEFMPLAATLVEAVRVNERLADRITGK